MTRPPFGLQRPPRGALLLPIALAVLPALILTGCKQPAQTPAAGPQEQPKEQAKAPEQKALTKAEAAKGSKAGMQGERERMVANSTRELRSPDPNIRKGALSQAQQFEEGVGSRELRLAVADLVRNDPDPSVQATAVSAYGGWVASYPEPVLKAARSDRHDVQLAAAITLREGKLEQVQAALDLLSRSQYADVASAARSTVATLRTREGGADALTLLIQDLGHNYRDRSAQAAMQIDQGFRKPETVPTLARALKDPDPDRRASAAMFLGIIAGGASPGQQRYLTRNQVAYRTPPALPKPRQEALAPLRDCLLNDTNPTAREAAAQGLGLIGDERAAAWLGKALSDPAEPVRRRAAAALTIVPAATVRDQLVAAATGDQSGAVRRYAMEALAILADPQVASDIAKGLRDADPEVRAYSAEVLGEIRASGVVPDLVALLDDESPTVRWRSALALGSLLSQKGAVPKDQQNAAADALVARLRDSSPQVAHAAERALQSMGLNRQVPAAAEIKDVFDDAQPAGSQKAGAAPAAEAEHTH